MLTKELILGILHGQKFTAKVYGSPADIISAEDFDTIAEEILLIAQPNSETAPPLQQADVSRNEVAVCPRCGDEHSTTDCHGYCTAACMQEDEGAKWSITSPGLCEAKVLLHVCLDEELKPNSDMSYLLPASCKTPCYRLWVGLLTTAKLKNSSLVKYFFGRVKSRRLRNL